jgi:LexA-binding, inner membrane-associated putative hydrolase
MFVGHFAVGLVAKRIAPQVSLGTLVMAAMLPDVLWPIFSIARIEYVAGGPAVTASDVFDAPFSHSLLMVAIWATLFAGGYYLWRHYPRGTWVLFVAVLSHWALDATAHKHALAPGSHSYYGLELWKSLPATIIVEGGFWLLAIILYVRATRPKKRAGVYAFWPVVAFLTYVWITNVRKGAPPPEAVIGSLIFFSLTIAWAYWMNRLRPLKLDSTDSRDVKSEAMKGSA